MYFAAILVNALGHEHRVLYISTFFMNAHVKEIVVLPCGFSVNAVLTTFAFFVLGSQLPYINLSKPLFLIERCRC